MAGEHRVPVRQESDIVAARQMGRRLASPLGFSETDLTLIATAISEIARNLVTYAQEGEMHFQLEDGGGITIVARDQGPGIPDLEQAMEDGFSSGSGLGLGLPGARRLMDDFTIESTVGVGTTVVMKKWVR